MRKHSNAMFMGHEKEPPTKGPHSGGKQPPMHSHSARPHRKGGIRKHSRKRG
jgi:hypothetical protein